MIWFIQLLFDKHKEAIVLKTKCVASAIDKVTPLNNVGRQEEEIMIPLAGKSCNDKMKSKMKMKQATSPALLKNVSQLIVMLKGI